jgi:hypothetical protein
MSEIKHTINSKLNFKKEAVIAYCYLDKLAQLTRP